MSEAYGAVLAITTFAGLLCARVPVNGAAEMPMEWCDQNQIPVA